MRKTVITYGLIAGCISAAMLFATSMVLKNVGFDKGEVIGYTSMILASLFIYFGMRSYRDNVVGGQIGYGKALSIGLLITAVSAVCYVIAWAIVYHFIFPDFMEKYSACMIDKVKAKGLPQVQIDKQIAEMQKFREMYKNPVWFSLLTFMEPLPVGVIVSFISAFIVRMKKKSASA